MRYVPWHVTGVRPEVREAATDAARRSGLSVGAWLNSLIMGVAAGRGRPPKSLHHAARFQRTRTDHAALAVLRRDIEDLRRNVIGAIAGVASEVVSRDVVAALAREIKALSDKITCQNGADHPMDEFLAQLRELRQEIESRLAAIQRQVATSAADAIGGPAESIRRDVSSLKEIQVAVDRRTQDTFEAIYGTIEQVVDRLAKIENRHFAAHPDQLADKPEQRAELATPPYPLPASALPSPASGEGLGSGAAEGREGTAPAAGAEALLPSAALVADRTASASATEPQAEHDRAATSSSNTSRPHHPSATTTRFPAIPDFAPGAPFVPGVPFESRSGARRVPLTANAIDRIAASEAVIGTARPAEPPGPLRTRFVVAARRAARAVVSEHAGTQRHRLERAGRDTGQTFRFGKLFGRLRQQAKCVVVGVGVVVLAIGGLYLSLDSFHALGGRDSVQALIRLQDTTQPGGEWVRPAQPPLDQAPTHRGTNLEWLASLVPGANPLPDETTFGQAPAWSGVPTDMVAGAAIPTSAATPTPTPPPYPPPQAWEGQSIYPPWLAAGERREGASSPLPNGVLPGVAGRDPASPSTSRAAPDLTATPLPRAIGGPALVAAAAAGDPGASYEVGIRFAQGRNVAQDLAMAAAWLERAARNGLVLAQFRLGSMYEKGLGVKRDLAEARRLYIAAADKGHAKAMHNLAVLYAGGIDGKPDYAAAAQWFRRAAVHGIVDSQYNLAILYARGVGVERNLAESYKWFALAANGGDRDAARKRDEIATRLDPRQLDSAKLNAEAFAAVPQPDQATSTKAPAGGWDQVAAATTRPKALVKPERFPGK